MLFGFLHNLVIPVPISIQGTEYRCVPVELFERWHCNYELCLCCYDHVHKVVLLTHIFLKAYRLHQVTSLISAFARLNSIFSLSSIWQGVVQLAAIATRVVQLHSHTPYPQLFTCLEIL
jgi:hypothetical protein